MLGARLRHRSAADVWRVIGVVQLLCIQVENGIWRSQRKTGIFHE
jgi:hypothetical protein